MNVSDVPPYSSLVLRDGSGAADALHRSAESANPVKITGGVLPALTSRGVPGFGMELFLDLSACTPEILKDGGDLLCFVEQLIDRIGMTAYGEPQVVDFGEGELHGITIVQLITTSNINLHAVPADGSLHLNVFSCRWFDAESAVDFSIKYFSAQDYRAHVAERTAPRV